MTATRALVVIGCLAVFGCIADDPPIGGTDDDDDAGFPQVVVLLTIDALNREYLGVRHAEWDTTPHIDALIAESAFLPDVLVTRSLTSVSFASFLTGLYPRSHGIRSNNADWEGAQPHLLELFQTAGYRTYGYSSNYCSFIDYGVDERFCAWLVEMPELTSQQEGDELLVQQLLDELDEHPAGEPLFIWLHLMDPHEPYSLIEPWYGEFHPETYDGWFDPEDYRDIADVTLGNAELSEEDRRHLQAVYASQVRSTDATIGIFLDGLAERGLYDDALIVFGADHGEVLAEHADYLYHGCSFHNAAMAVSWSIRQPGLRSAGTVLDGWVSTVDMPSTILELAGVDGLVGVEGRSLAADIGEGSLTARDLFFERSPDTAGVISGRYKYTLNPNETFADCAPYTYEGAAYPGEAEELYDLQEDPDEMVNLSADPPAVMAGMHIAVCNWVLQDTWVDPDMDEQNVLVRKCQ